MISMLIIQSVWDCRFRQIPICVTVFGGLAGLVLSLWQGRDRWDLFMALIPGEVIELGAGYAYGAVEGLLICLAGVAVSSAAIFLLVKKLGTPMVELFISREKIQQFKFINSEKKLKRLVFLLFLIPGTPKDALTYFVGLTEMKLSTFLGLSLLARIPSVVSSTISGQLLGDKDFLTAGIVYAITGVISIAGYLIYSYVMKKRENNETKDRQ